MPTENIVRQEQKQQQQQRRRKNQLQTGVIEIALEYYMQPEYLFSLFYL